VEIYINKCVDSLLAQTYKNIEIILIDDGSPDNCSEICDRYARESPRGMVKVIHQSNKGAAMARNAGIAAASGEWIMFVDGDDWVEPEMVEVMLERAEAAGGDLCAAGYYSERLNHRVVFAFDNLTHYQVGMDDKMVLFKSHMCETQKLGGFNENVPLSSQCFKLYRTSLIKGNNIFFKEGVIFGEDVLFSMHTLYCAEKIVFCKDIFYHYRMNPSSAVNSYKEKALASAASFLVELSKFTSLISNREEAAEIYNVQGFFIFLFSVKNTYRSANSPYSLMQKIRGIKKLIRSEPYRNIIKNVNPRFINKEKRIQLLLLRHMPVSLYHLIMRVNDRKR